MTNAYHPGSRFSQNSPYGERIDPKTGKLKLHAGEDFRAEAGTPIPAAASGEVVYSGLNEGLGNVVIVKNDAGGYSLYAHMQNGDRAELGRRVWQGDTLGLVGSTGKSTGNHLHYAVIKDEAGNIIKNSKLPRNGGSIGIALNKETTVNPSTYDNYRPTLPYLGETKRATEIMSGAGATSRGSLPSREDSFAERYGKWGLSSTGIVPIRTPESPASFADRFGNWGSTPAGGFGATRSQVLRELEKYRRSAVPDGPASISPTNAGSGGVGTSPPVGTPAFIGPGIPFVSAPAGSLAARDGSALLDSAPMNPATPGPFSTSGRFVPRSLPSQPLYPIGELVPASNGRAHDRQGLLDDRSGYGSSSPADADRFRSRVLRELQKYRQLAASGVAMAPSSASSNRAIPHASSGNGAEGASGGILKWIGNGLISSAEASPSKLLAQGNAEPGFPGDNDGSISDANEAASPSARDDRRYLSGRIANQAFAFDTSAPAVPFIASNGSLSPDRPNSFDDRFGSWRSTSGVPQQASRPRGLFTGEPMPDWPVTPAIFDFPNRSSSRDEVPKSGAGIPLLDEYIRYLNRKYCT